MLSRGGGPTTFCFPKEPVCCPGGFGCGITLEDCFGPSCQSPPLTDFGSEEVKFVGTEDNLGDFEMFLFSDGEMCSVKVIFKEISSINNFLVEGVLFRAGVDQIKSCCACEFTKLIDLVTGEVISLDNDAGCSAGAGLIKDDKPIRDPELNRTILNILIGDFVDGVPPDECEVDLPLLTGSIVCEESSLQQARYGQNSFVDTFLINKLNLNK